MSTQTATLPALAPDVPMPSTLQYDASVVRVLWQRDLVRFLRQRSRIIGALIQPLIFWGVIGTGLSGSFRIPGMEHVSYVEYFYPGVVMLVVLFTSIFTTMSVIEDRHKGFLQAVLVAPAHRAAVVLGKTAGGVTIAMGQAVLFLLLLPLGGYSVLQVSLVPLLAILLGASIALSALGFAIAWWLDSTQGYHVVMNLLLLPLWILSGAMFPLQNGPRWMAFVERCNPVAYAVSGVRRHLLGAHADPRLLVAGSSSFIELTVVWLFALAMVIFAVRLVRNRAL